jgi:hypothetical protein
VKNESYAPSMYGTSKIRFDYRYDVYLEEDEEQYMMALKKVSSTKYDNKQAVLIFFKSKE